MCFCIFFYFNVIIANKKIHPPLRSATEIPWGGVGCGSKRRQFPRGWGGGGCLIESFSRGLPTLLRGLRVRLANRQLLCYDRASYQLFYCEKSFKTISNYWKRLSKISWFITDEQINYLPKPKAGEVWQTPPGMEIPGGVGNGYFLELHIVHFSP